MENSTEYGMKIPIENFTESRVKNSWKIPLIKWKTFMENSTECKVKIFHEKFH